MTQVSRPVLIALAATILFLGLWLVALRPSSGASPASSPTASAPAAGTSAASGASASHPGRITGPTLPGVAGLTRAIAKAHGAVTTSDAQSNAAAHENALTPGAGTPPAASASTAVTSPSDATSGTRTAGQRAGAEPTIPATIAGTSAAARVAAALREHRPVAVLFFNPGGAVDEQMRSELTSLPAPSALFKLSVPISELAQFPVITSAVQVADSPTLVLIDRTGQLSTLVGFADRFTVGRRVAGLLAH